MDISTRLETSRSYEELSTILQYSGCVCIESPTGKMAILHWPTLSKGGAPPNYRGKTFKYLLINRNTLSVIAFGLPHVYRDDYCVVTEACIHKRSLRITELFDARYITMFYHQGQWWSICDTTWDMTTMRCDEGYNIQELWEESQPSGFLDAHSTDVIYVYQLIHYSDRHIVDYTSRFGPKYSKLLLVFTRSSTTFEIISPAVPVMLCDQLLGQVECPDFLVLDKLNEEDEKIEHLLDIHKTGVCVSSGYTMIHLHTYSYRLYIETCNTNVKPCEGEHYLGLYQKNMMDIYLSKFKNETFYLGSDGIQYQIKGLIDSIFKILTSEILHLFKTFWDIKYGTQREEYRDMYAILPNEYKKVFYILRGIYFSNKVNNFTTYKFITVKTVYEMLKKLEPVTLVSLLKERRRILTSGDKLKKLSVILLDYSSSEFLDKTSRIVDHATDFIFGVKQVNATIPKDTNTFWSGF